MREHMMRLWCRQKGLPKQSLRIVPLSATLASVLCHFGVVTSKIIKQKKNYFGIQNFFFMEKKREFEEI